MMSAEGAIAPRRAGGRLAAVLRRRPAVHRPRPDRPRRGGGRLDVGWAHLALSSRPLVSRASRRMARQWRKRRAEAAQGDLAPERSTGSAAAAERIAAIIDAAEQAASKVIDDAGERRPAFTSRRHGPVPDRVVAERLRALADELDPLEVTSRSEPHLRSVEPLLRRARRRGGEKESPSAMPGRKSSAGARLLATQMAVSGSSREEVGDRLRSGFEIEDTSEILDAILGPEE